MSLGVNPGSFLLPLLIMVTVGRHSGHDGRSGELSEDGWNSSLLASCPRMIPTLTMSSPIQNPEISARAPTNMARAR